MIFNNDDDDYNTVIIPGTSRLQDPKPLTENEGSKKQQGSLLTNSFFTQNLMCLTFWASENFTIGQALKNNKKLFLPRDHVC